MGPYVGISVRGSESHLAPASRTRASPGEKECGRSSRAVRETHRPLRRGLGWWSWETCPCRVSGRGKQRCGRPREGHVPASPNGHAPGQGEWEARCERSQGLKMQVGQGEPLDSLKQEGGWLSSVPGPKPVSLKVRGTWREHSRQLGAGAKRVAEVPAHKRNCGRSVGGRAGSTGGSGYGVRGYWKIKSAGLTGEEARSCTPPDFWLSYLGDGGVPPEDRQLGGRAWGWGNRADVIWPGQGQGRGVWMCTSKSSAERPARHAQKGI